MYFKDQDMEINRNNYETFFLLYLDRELSPADRLSVEKFLGEHTDLQKEFALLQQTVYSPVDVVFDDKKSLFRQEENKRIIPMFWMRTVAAIVVLILGGWLMIARLSGNRTNPAGPADRLTADKKGSSNSNSDNKNPSVQTKTDAVAEIRPASRQDKPEIVIKKPQKRIPVVNSDKESQKSGQPGVEDLAAGENLTAHPKSNTELEIQSPEKQADNGTAVMAMTPAGKAPVLLLAVSSEKVQPGNNNEVQKDSDLQSESAISVIALNDQNKGISRFFKKLTRAAPEDDNPRKVRVSVFQISY
jgi:hypothetical protein